MRVDEHTIELDSSPAFYRSAPTTGVAPVYLHGMPTSSDDWIAPLSRTGGVAIDLIGFGRSSKAGYLDYSIGGLASFAERMIGQLAIERLHLVAHDWGVPVALELALRDPSRIERIALISPPPLIEGFPWPRLERLLRARGVGEMLMGAISRRLLARGMRRASATAEAWPEERLSRVWEQFDQGTQRAVLRLLRRTDECWVGARAPELGQLPLPVLVLTGERDPRSQPGLADAYAAILGGQTEAIAGAGHWPWLDRPQTIDRLAGFLGS